MTEFKQKFSVKRETFGDGENVGRRRDGERRENSEGGE